MLARLLALLHPIRAWHSGALRRKAKGLAVEIEGFLAERDDKRPLSSGAPQDSPKWVRERKRKQDHGDETMRLFWEGGYWTRVQEFARKVKIEGAREPFVAAKPRSTSDIRKLVEQLREYSELKRLIR